MDDLIERLKAGCRMEHGIGCEERCTFQQAADEIKRLSDRNRVLDSLLDNVKQLVDAMEIIRGN